jgi:hypothetical protein
MVNAFHGYGFEKVGNTVCGYFQMAFDSLSFRMRFPDLEAFQEPIGPEYDDSDSLDIEYERPLTRIGL